jgi:O-antigen ligase
MLLVLTELLLGGSGHYFELADLSIRTLFIIFFFFLWLSYSWGQETLKLRLRQLPASLSALLFLLAAVLMVSAFVGIQNSHTIKAIIQDIIPFAFLILLYPAGHLLSDPKNQEYLIRLIVVSLVGTACFSIITFILFSTGTAVLQDQFYLWCRWINDGKITNLGNNFFRIVESAHLFIVPIILLITSLLMRDERHNKMWRLLRILAILVLVLNLSRGYFLALLLGLLVLKYKHRFKKWFVESLAVCFWIAALFTGISLIASHGQTLGWEQFGIRLQSFINPTIEASSATRMMKLPIIWEQIKQHPLLGNGVGSTITFYNSLTYRQETTPYYDWGYLEMLAETGIVGTIILLSIYLYAAYLLIKKIKNIPDWHDFDVGLLAGIVAFLVMNLTISALFHVFGILFLVFALTIALKQTTIFEQITTLLYRVFNRLK